jgi:23S rRNA (adenine2503-C2)-methyltransferase
MLETMTTETVFNYTRSGIARLTGSVSRANRIYHSVYRDHVADLEAFDLSLPSIIERFESSDGVRRYLIRLQDGESVESVLIPEEGRHTFCVSSQVGCALACKFCLTGQLGLTRNLSAGEIVSQVLLLSREMPSQSTGRFSVVLMGMGEPLQNYENVLTAIEILTDDHGLHVPLRRITLSTAGLLPGIERLATERLFPNLSISLTGATDEIRDDLMPINRKYPIADVIATVRCLAPSRKKRVMFEYVMIKKLTDSIDDARRLSTLLDGLGSKVNLIPLNESADIPYQRSERSVILAFQQVLLRNGIATFIRKTRGSDVSGACGQLKLRTAPDVKRNR